LHPSLECFELAQRRRALSRALRAPGSLSTATLASYLSTQDMTENLYGKQVEKL